jgi:hypothetical protein
MFKSQIQIPTYLDYSGAVYRSAVTVAAVMLTQLTVQYAWKTGIDVTALSRLTVPRDTLRVPFNFT